MTSTDGVVGVCTHCQRGGLEVFRCTDGTILLRPHTVRKDSEIMCQGNSTVPEILYQKNDGKIQRGIDLAWND
jgi:hypothetical protein